MCKVNNTTTSKELKEYLFMTQEGNEFLTNERKKFANLFTGELKQNLLNKAKEICYDSSSSV